MSAEELEAQIAAFIDRLDLEGSIIEVIDQVPVFIRRNTRLYPKIAGMRREDIPAYPVAAVRGEGVTRLIM